MNKPIDPKLHIAIDYGLSALQIVGPELLGLGRRANAVGTLFGVAYGATAAMTDTSLGISRVVSFEAHGLMEPASIAAMAVVPWLTGACKRPKAKLFFLSSVGLALVNYLMTDFNRNGTEAETVMSDVSDAASEVLDPL